MQGHGSRETYFIVGQGTVELSVPAPGAAHAASALPPPPPPAVPAPEVKFKFGWMSGKSRHTYSPQEQEAITETLVGLGRCMNDPKGCHGQPDDNNPGDSLIPAGYTYLGQFLAHEITFDKLADAPDPPEPDNYRSPEIDLDSLYGAGPEGDPRLYKDYARLKVGPTSEIPNLNQEFQNDLPRDQGETEKRGQALIVDPRNDENLAVAQTHVAFIKFHNKVVDWLEESGCPRESAFVRAREEVIKHFQWIILEDYLPRLVDQGVLDRVRQQGLEKWKFEKREELFMPLEFSAAAFRIGHSMVRNKYEWNKYHTSESPVDVPPAKLIDLFNQTKFSGKLGGGSKLTSDWVIDWRRFYDFEGFDQYPTLQPNMAKRLNTFFSLRLDKIANFPHNMLEGIRRAITVRNLLRGFALGLPTGEEVAEWLGLEPLTAGQLADGPQQHLLGNPVFQGRTPLWFYILKEAEQSGGSRLGPVGSSIVAGTLVEIIRHSRSSILRDTDWSPKFGRPAQGAAPARFEMADLLHFADVVDPIGKHQGYA